MEGTFEKVPSKPPSKLSTHFLKVRTYGSECGNAKNRFVLPAQHQKVRRVFCGLFNICLPTPPIGREAALLWRVERVRFCKRCLGGDVSPLISRCRDSFPPRGSLFKIPSVLYSKKEMQEFGRRFIFVILMLPEILFAMFAQRKEGFPLGGSCRVSD